MGNITNNKRSGSEGRLRILWDAVNKSVIFMLIDKEDIV